MLNNKLFFVIIDRAIVLQLIEAQNMNDLNHLSVHLDKLPYHFPYCLAIRRSFSHLLTTCFRLIPDLSVSWACRKRWYRNVPSANFFFLNAVSLDFFIFPIKPAMVVNYKNIT